MDYIPFNFVIISVSIVNILMNTFLIFCMTFTQQKTGRLKQPLNVLLGTLLGCNITLQLCNFMCSIVDFFLPLFMNYFIILQITLFAMRTSVTAYLWLNVFYYCQIVPAKCSFFIWLKINIRFFIYSALIADKVFFLFGLSAGIMCSVVHVETNENNLNTTYTQFVDIQKAKMDSLQVVFVVDMWLRCGYLSLCLCVMLTANFATILYLRKHMKTMEGSISSFSSPCLQTQMRVTVTGIIQTFLSFFCLVWMIMEDVLLQYADLYGYISGTLISFYTLGTTINLCIGQTVFRQCVVEVYQKCLQTFAFESF